MFKVLSAVLMLVTTNSYAVIVTLPDEATLKARISDALMHFDEPTPTIKCFHQKKGLAAKLANQEIEAEEVAKAVKEALTSFTTDLKIPPPYPCEHSYVLIKTILFHEPDAFEDLILAGKISWISLKVLWARPDIDKQEERTFGLHMPTKDDHEEAVSEEIKPKDEVSETKLPETTGRRKRRGRHRK